MAMPQPGLQGNVQPATSPDEVRFGDYDLLVQPSARKRLILSVASIGNPGQPPPREWRGLLSSLAGDDHRIFVRDLAKSWFNSPAGWQEMIDWIGDYMARHGITDCRAFGLSMGGYGAAMLAAALPIGHVLMLAPQAAIDAEAGFDGRFTQYWDALTARDRPSIRTIAAPNTRFSCIFTVDFLWDVLHAAIIRDALPDCRMLPVHGEHNVANELKDRREHLSLFRWFLGETDSPGITLFEGDGERLFTDARHLRDDMQRPVQRSVDHIVSHAGIWAVPGICYPQLDRALWHRAARLYPTYSETQEHCAYPLRRGLRIFHAHVRPYLGDNWSDSEHLGYWSVGTDCSFRATMVDRDMSAGAQLQLGCQLFVPPGRTRVVRIHEGDRLLGSWSFTNDTPHAMNMPARLTVRICQRFVDLRIETPDPVSPAEIGEGADGRALGLWLQEIRVPLHAPAVRGEPAA